MNQRGYYEKQAILGINPPSTVNSAALPLEFPGWSGKPLEAAIATSHRYGPPHEVCASRLIWNRVGPWKRTEIWRDEVPHDFPMPHTDMLQQVIDFPTPVGWLDAEARYDGSVIFDRTRGEMSARCDVEEMNLLALNLAVDVMFGRRPADNARSFYAWSAVEFKRGRRDNPYTSGLLFEARPGSGFRDVPIV